MRHADRTLVAMDAREGSSSNCAAGPLHEVAHAVATYSVVVNISDWLGRGRSGDDAAHRMWATAAGKCTTVRPRGAR